MAQPEILDRKFGFFVVKTGIATKAQVIEALQEQKRQAAKGNTIRLGDILVQQKILTAEQKDKIVKIQLKSGKQSGDKTKTPEDVEPKEVDQEEAAAESAETEEEPPDLENAKKVQNSSGFELAITPDRISAYIYPLEKDTPGIELETIKNLIEMENVSYGILDDEKINEYLKSRPGKDQLFKIAQGEPVDLGKPTEIKYHFDVDYVKPGTIDESGNIDYKNRGKIPWVKAEDLLAEIIPGTEGKSGTDVYGKSVDPPPPDIISLKNGINVKKSEDGLKAIAEIEGRPLLLDDGTINITDTLPIPGDVGVETGNIEFEGNIDVKGAVQEGYRVKCKSLRAQEVHNAEIETQEDIVIAKGIIGAKIRTEGTVKARHVRDTTIDALGDVTIEKEVYEAHIETNGIFRMDRGTAMGSTLSAMKGVEILDIGSEGSDPCTIITGIDNRLENQVTKFNVQISNKEKEAEKIRTLLKDLLGKPKILEEEISELAQHQDMAMQKSRSLKETLKSLQKDNDRKNIKKVLTITKALNFKLKKYQDAIDKRVKAQEEAEGKIKKYNEDIEKREQEIQELQDDIKSIVELAKIRQPSSGVRVSGTVYDRTFIRGRNASLIVKGNLNRVHFQEIKNPDEKSDQSWLMSVSSF